MATSGITTLSFDVSEIIEEALDRIGGEPIKGYEPRSARRSLNLLLTDWVNRGVNLWTVEEKSQALTKGTASYQLPADTVDVIDAVLRRDNIDTPLYRISYKDYLNRPNKTEEGKPVEYMIERLQSGVTMRLWETPENSTDVVQYWRVRYMQSVTASAQDVDVVRRFLPALVSGLAYEMSKKRSPLDEPERMGAWMQRTRMLKLDYEEEFMRAAQEDSDRASFMVTPAIPNMY